MDDRLLALERALAAQAEQNTALLSQLGEQRSRVEALEVQKALAEKDLAVQRMLAAKDLEIQRLREGAGGDEAVRTKVIALEQKTRSLELEKKDATIEALKAKTRMTARELKALKSKAAVAAKGAYVETEEEGESGDEPEEQDPVQRAVEIGQRKHVNLKRVDRLWLVKWTGPQRMHAVHFNHLKVFVRAVSSVVLEWEDDADDTEEEEAAEEGGDRASKKKRGGGRKRKRHGHVNKERLALLELERPMAYEDVAALVRALCDLDLLIGPVYLQSEFQVWPKSKDAPINPGRWQVRVSWLRTLLANDNFMRQSRQYIEDYIMGRKDRHFSCDDCWLFLTKLAD